MVKYLFKKMMLSSSIFLFLALIVLFAGLNLLILCFITGVTCTDTRVESDLIESVKNYCQVQSGKIQSWFLGR